jgi:recombination protein RecR
MQYSSRCIEVLIEELGRLPGIGRKSAQRMAFHLLRRPSEEVLALAEAIRDVKERVSECSTCGNISESETCLICADSKRQDDVFCVVENPVDVVAIERTGVFKGRYHVLGGGISPLDGVGPDDIRTHELVDRVKKGGVKEVILATSASSVGEATAHYLEQILRVTGVRVSRIARGIPMGSDLEFADQVTLQKALEGRRTLG